MSALEQDCEFAADLEPHDSAASLEPEFESFYREHYGFVWRSARRMLPGAGDDAIEDLIQDTWITVYRRFDSFEGRCRPTTWLFGILRNVARNHGRGERRRARRVTAFAAREQIREQTRAQTREWNDASQALAKRMLDEFLATLDADKRAVFVLAELEGHSGREIANALAINPNTAQSRLRAARREFCAYFELPASREQITARTRALREHPPTPSAQQRARSRALLLGGLGQGSWAASAGGGLGLAVFGKGVLVKLAAVVGTLVVVGVGVRALDVDEPEAAPAAVSAEPRAREISTPPIELAAARSLEPTNEELAPIPVAAVPVPHAVEPKLDAYDLLRQARAALVAEQPERALALLSRIPGKTAALRDERVATQIAALCRLERGAEAEAVAREYAAAVPDSPLLAKIDSACW